MGGGEERERERRDMFSTLCAQPQPANFCEKIRVPMDIWQF